MKRFEETDCRRQSILSSFIKILLYTELKFANWPIAFALISIFSIFATSNELRSEIRGSLNEKGRIAVGEFENYTTNSGISKMLQFEIRNELSKCRIMVPPEEADAVVSGSITSYNFDVSYNPLYYDGGFGSYFYIQGTTVTTYSSMQVIVKVTDNSTGKLIDEFSKSYSIRDVGYENVQCIKIREGETWQKGLSVGSLAASAYNIYKYDPPQPEDKIRSNLIVKISDKILSVLLNRPEKIESKKKAKPGGSCFIATSAFGSATAPEVEILREFRDTYLLKNRFGRLFVVIYYKVSPPLAYLLSKSRVGCALTRLVLKPITKSLKIWINNPRKREEENIKEQS